METRNQIKSIGKTVGFALIVIGLVYLGFFLFGRDHTAPPAAIVGVAAGVILLVLCKRR